MRNLTADINTIAPTDAEILREQAQELQSVHISRAELQEACKQNMDMFAGTMMPDTCILLYPATFKAMWELLTQAIIKQYGFDRFAVGIPRGFTKTTVLKLLVLYAIFYTDRNFILLICKTAKHAINFLSDVTSVLDSPNVKAIYGDWRAATDRDTQDLLSFRFRGRDIVLAGMGNEGSVRGFNLVNRRPDVIIMDDMQPRENAASPVLSDALLEWMIADLMKAASKQRCCYMFVGNMYPFPGSILRKLKQNPAWTSFIAGGLLADGESIWPELQSREQLLEEFENDLALGKPEIFLAEVLNDDTASGKSGVDVTAIPRPDDSLFEEPMLGSFIIIDPSNDKKRSDLAEIGYFEVRDTVPCMITHKAGRWNPEVLICEALVLAMEKGCKLVAVESVAFQYSLLYWFERITQQRQLIGFNFVELYPQGSKNARIKEMLGFLLTGKLLLHKDTRNDVIYQINHWNPLKTDNIDDLLDVLAYAYQVMDKYQHLIAADIFHQINCDAQAKVLALEDNSLF